MTLDTYCVHVAEASLVLTELYSGNRAQLVTHGSYVITDITSTIKGCRCQYVGNPGTGRKAGKRGQLQGDLLGTDHFGGPSP